jgi:tetratricopeptide (TPR) repeat protein
MTIRRPFAALLLSLLVLALVWPDTARAQVQGGTAQTYTNCLDLAQEDPESARRMAEEWVTLGGGNPARHCAAIALLGLLRYEEAAIRLQTLVDLLADAPVERQAAAREQAAQAWLLAGQADRAESNLTAALALRPGDVELLISRAIARASATDYWNAIDDLNAALATAPDRIDALVLRATAYRYLDSLELARQDAERLYFRSLI